MPGARQLRSLLARPGIVVAPGGFDPVSARLVEREGFEAIYMTGYGTSLALTGLPDVGLTTMSEMVANARYIAAAVRTPLIADADTGFGNAINVIRTVREYIGAGVAGIHLEDQVNPKRCGHVAGRLVIPMEEAVGKIRAAVDTRNQYDPDFVIIARTDAGWLQGGGGLEDAVARACAYGAAGADLVFLAGVRSPSLGRVRHRIPFALCSTDSPGTTVAEDEANGVKLVLHYALALFAAYRAVRDVLREFRATGDRPALRERYLVDEAEFERFIGFDRIVELATRHRLDRPPDRP